MSSSSPVRQCATIFYTIADAPLRQRGQFLFYSNEKDKFMLSFSPPVDLDHSTQEKTMSVFADYLFYTYDVELQDLPAPLSFTEFHTVQEFIRVEVCAQNIATPVMPVFSLLSGHLPLP